MSVVIHGICQSRFDSVRSAFARCFEELGEVGAGACVYVDGEAVVDLWAGHADPATGREWEKDTIVHVYSVTKAFAATCLLRLVDQGKVELDAPVATYWPEFAQAGKQQLPVRWLLTHQAGLLGVRQQLPAEAIFEWQTITNALAAESPWWKPGTEVGEHAYFFGHLVGEIVRRVDGRSLGTYLRDEVTGPLGLDFHVGLTPDEEARCAHVVGMNQVWRVSLNENPTKTYEQAMGNPPGLCESDVINSSAWRQAEIPAVNGHGTAHSIARFYSGLAAGGAIGNECLLSRDMVRNATSIHASGHDVLLQSHINWGLGFQIERDGFGFGGLGGALGWGNINHRLGFAYVTNHMGSHDRAMAVYEAAARVIGLEVAT